MAQELVMNYLALKKLQGKKLLWVGTDEETEQLLVLFEGMTVIVMPDELVIVSDGAEFCKKYLEAQQTKTEMLVSLTELMKEKPNDGPKAPQQSLKTGGPLPVNPASQQANHPRVGDLIEASQ